MCPERLVHNRERAGGKRVLARQACQRPGARLPAALRGAARWTLAGWSSRSVVSSCGCAASCCPARRGQVDAGGLVQPQRGQLLRLRGPHSLPDSSCARGSPHRTDPAANTSRRRSARCSYSSTHSASARWSTVPADTSGAAKTSRRYDPVISDPATSSQLLYVPRMLLPAGLGVLRLLRAACTCLYVDRPCESAGVRTYGVQRIRHEHHRASFVQVRCHVELQAGAYCKTVGSAYVGSNPTPATHLRRSEPVTLNCVTGFCVQNERLRKPSALFRGLCVGWIRSSPGRCGYRLRCLLSCGNASGGGCLRAVLRAGQARWPWAMRGTGDRFAYR